jgi:hypothetical protein
MDMKQDKTISLRQAIRGVRRGILAMAPGDF